MRALKIKPSEWPIPDARDIDIADARETVAFSRLLLMYARREGCMNLDGHRPTAAETEIRMSMRVLADRIRNHMPGYSDEDLYDIVSNHELLHRISYHEIPDQKRKEDWLGRYFGSWLDGNPAISEADIYGMIAPKARLNPAKVDSRQLSAYCSLRDEWCKALEADSRFIGITEAENYHRLSLLLDEPLRYRYRDRETAMKLAWIDANQVGDLSRLSTDALMHYRVFDAKARHLAMRTGHLTKGTTSPAATRDHEIITLLTTRTDLHPYDRQAFGMMMEIL